MATIIKIKTWRCPDCDYSQDFDPNDSKLMHIHFPGYPVDLCPACYGGRNPQREKKAVLMNRETLPEKKATITIKDESEVDAEVDADEDIASEDKQVEKERRKQEIRDAIVKFTALQG